MTDPISVTVSSGVAISAESTLKTPATMSQFSIWPGGTNNAGVNVVSANTCVQRVRSDRP